MSDGKLKPAIPAWQRAPISKPTATEDGVSQAEERQTEGAVPVAAPRDSEAADDEAESVTGHDADASPTTAAPADPIEAKVPVPAFETSDFESFKQQSIPPRPQQQRSSAPPIITYPEFLVEAHRPPPLITPTRILNTIYAAGGITAILYGASKWVMTPMVDALSDSRHDFFTHSQTKVDEFNDRLSKIVTKIPASKPDASMPEVDDDVESETSDPTELYHRDMGTQTSPLPSRRPSLPDTSEPKKDAVTYQSTGLQILKDHMAELADGSERAAEANKDRQETLNKLRHYLDGLIYTGAGLHSWQTSEDAIAMKNSTDGKAGEDAIEELKKEIRGVKGVLLSAKRFPAVSRPLAGVA